jgi:hypothetical protein
MGGEVTTLTDYLITWLIIMGYTAATVGTLVGLTMLGDKYGCGLQILVGLFLLMTAIAAAHLMKDNHDC